MPVDLDKIRALLASVAGFTPGPWGWSADRELCLVPGLVTPRGLYIMTGWTAAAPVEVKPCTPADGRMLAAAPDLHRELTEAVGEIERLRAHNARMADLLNKVANAMDLAEHALIWTDGAEMVTGVLPLAPDLRRLAAGEVDDG